jgi:hypothetical protein
MHPLNHVHEEQESEVQVEQAQAKETNIDTDQGKPNAIPNYPWSFFNHYLCVEIDCVLSL